MATAFRTDLDSVALSYLKNQVNGNINPYNALWVPAYCQTAPLANFSRDPYESHPSLSIAADTPMNFMQLRAVMMALGEYYAWIAKGHYGLLTTRYTSPTGPITRSYQFEGRVYFYFNNTAPGAAALHANNMAQMESTVPVVVGNTEFEIIQVMYTAMWNVVNNNKDGLEVDLTVCHSSCHTSCHGSRGRR